MAPDHFLVVECVWDCKNESYLHFLLVHYRQEVHSCNKQLTIFILRLFIISSFLFFSCCYRFVDSSLRLPLQFNKVYSNKTKWLKPQQCLYKEREVVWLWTILLRWNDPTAVSNRPFWQQPSADSREKRLTCQKSSSQSDVWFVGQLIRRRDLKLHIKRQPIWQKFSLTLK